MYYLLVNRTWWAFHILEAFCFILTPASQQHRPSTSSLHHGPEWISQPVQAPTAGIICPLHWHLHLSLLRAVVPSNTSPQNGSHRLRRSRITPWMNPELTAARMSHEQERGEGWLVRGCFKESLHVVCWRQTNFKRKWKLSCLLQHPFACDLWLNHFGAKSH